MNVSNTDEEQTNRSYSLKRSAKAFSIFSVILFIVMYGSYYLGLYGFSISPLFKGEKDLWTPVHHYIILALCGGAAAAGGAYSRKIQTATNKKAATNSRA